MNICEGSAGNSPDWLRRENDRDAIVTIAVLFCEKHGNPPVRDDFGGYIPFDPMGERRLFVRASPFLALEAEMLKVGSGVVWCGIRCAMG